MEIKKTYEIIAKPLERKGRPALRDIKTIDTIILHHSACVGRSVEDINLMHIMRGYVCIGYHFYIRDDGIYVGRATSEVGAHCRGHNRTSIGICLEGDFRTQEPTANQIKYLRKLIAGLEETIGRKLDIKLHRDFANTLCPARDLIADLKALEEQDKEE